MRAGHILRLKIRGRVVGISHGSAERVNCRGCDFATTGGVLWPGRNRVGWLLLRRFLSVDKFIAALEEFGGVTSLRGCSALGLAAFGGHDGVSPSMASNVTTYAFYGT
jgi:hypothetical protein